MKAKKSWLISILSFFLTPSLVFAKQETWMPEMIENFFEFIYIKLPGYARAGNNLYVIYFKFFLWIFVFSIFYWGAQ